MKKKKKIIIATIKPWNIAIAKKFHDTFRGKYQVIIISSKSNFTYQRIRTINPEYIFFPHWSWKIAAEIYENFNCVVFHMTDLPFGRGGSPLQNLIVRGKTKTKISAIKVVKDIDAGSIYLKKDLSLKGPAQSIYEKASKIIFNEMIPRIVGNRHLPKPQRGRVVFFKRREPRESRIPAGSSIKGIYDHIRMLDAYDYPHAFIETKDFRIEFTKAYKDGNSVVAQARIKKRSDDEA
ncbi:MAG: methionyl-tRNA formyltransferase [Candidatus Omnitrophica bacterium]|nr:methionyl-tRNA formyltransferase [Candidatus Omnitrophota bacterium]